MSYNVNDMNLDIAICKYNHDTEQLMTFRSYTDYGWLLAEVEHGPLTRKDAYVSLPYANDVIDFSTYAEGPYYEPREVKYTFFKKFESSPNTSAIERMLTGTREFEEVLTERGAHPGYIERIYDPTIDGQYWSGGLPAFWYKARCTGVEHTYHNLSAIAEVIVTYRVYPIPQEYPNQ